MDVMDEILALQAVIDSNLPHVNMGDFFHLRELKNAQFKQHAHSWYPVEYANWNDRTRRDIIQWCQDSLSPKNWLIYQPLGASEVLLMRHKSDAILCKLSVESLGGKKI